MNNRYIILVEYKFVYLVVPKMACLSINVVLTLLFDDFDPTPHRTSENNPTTIRIHRLCAVSRHQINRKKFLKTLKGGGYRDHFKFAFAPNPWDGLVYPARALVRKQPQLEGSHQSGGQDIQ